MFSSLTNRFLIVGILGGLLLGCGEEWNVNKIFISKNQKDALVSLIEDAQIAYDDGRFKDALKYAEKAEKISPHNEQIAILLGYINLSLSGMDTFKLAGGLIAASKNKDKESDDQKLIASSSRATSFFDKLKAVLDLNQETLEKFGTVSSEDNLEAFADHDVILPISAPQARALEDVEVIQRLNQAIKKICPFVNEELRIGDLDERHNAENCPTTSTIREKEVISHFLWAFVHIAEAVVFYSVVQYQEEGKEAPNIALRAEALESEAGTMSVGSYANHAVSLSQAMSKIYAVDDPDSQFTALVNNLAVAADTFATIGKMPTKIKQSLTRAVDSINAKTGEVSGASDTEKQSNSFKNQINKKIAGNMATQINDYAQNDPDDFAANKDELCGSYATVSGGASTPAACKDEE